MATYNREDVLEFWNRDEVESMYDKHLLNGEIDAIRRRIPEGSRVLDAGCGEGEGTLAYSAVPGVTVHGVDFSETRLRKARERLHSCANVTLAQADLLADEALPGGFDVVISQRFVINVTEWSLQQKLLLRLIGLVNPGGRLLMLEGSRDGVEELNRFRAGLGLPPIDVKWHNLFFDDSALETFMERNGLRLLEKDGLGAYLLLTRGLRPVFDAELNWDCDFNKRAASKEISDLLGLRDRFSRLKLWVFRKT